MVFGLWILISAMEAFLTEMLLAEAQQYLPTATARARPSATVPQVVEAAADRELQAARAALASVREEAAAVGRQLLPLRSPRDLATLLQMELLYPPGTPKRSCGVCENLTFGGRCGVCDNLTRRCRRQRWWRQSVCAADRG